MKPKNSLRNNIVECIACIPFAIGIASIFPCWLFYKENWWGPIMVVSILLSLLIDHLFIDKEAQNKYIDELEEYYDYYEDEEE